MTSLANITGKQALAGVERERKKVVSVIMIMEEIKNRSKTPLA